MYNYRASLCQALKLFERHWIQASDLPFENALTSVFIASKYKKEPKDGCNPSSLLSFNGDQTYDKIKILHLLSKTLNISMNQFETIAVFDFDHTLTDRDSFLSFLFYYKGFWKTFFHLLLLIPDFFRFCFGKLTRQQIKESVISSFLLGEPYNRIELIGKHYADSILDQFIKPEGLQKLRWHQIKGHRCLLVSASLEFYLIPWAMRNGFEKVIASRLALTSAGKITGELQESNCWGPEKEKRLLVYLGPKKHYELYVYGDSRGDREILNLADHPFYQKFE